MQAVQENTRRYYQTAKDEVGDTIKPRLAKCGADMTRGRFINEEKKQLSMTDERIEKAIRQNYVRMMIRNPIQVYLGANVDMNRANEIRPLFHNLSNIAERTGYVIVLSDHLNKDRECRAMKDLSGWENMIFLLMMHR